MLSSALQARPILPAPCCSALSSDLPQDHRNEPHKTRSGHGHVHPHPHTDKHFCLQVSIVKSRARVLGGAAVQLLQRRRRRGREPSRAKKGTGLLSTLTAALGGAVSDLKAMPGPLHAHPSASSSTSHIDSLAIVSLPLSSSFQVARPPQEPASTLKSLVHHPHPQ